MIIRIDVTVRVGKLGKVVRTSAYLGRESNMTALSAVIDSIISAQVVGAVAGQSPEKVSSEYLRISTGVYDAAAIGGIQVRSNTGTIWKYCFTKRSMIPLHTPHIMEF